MQSFFLNYKASRFHYVRAGKGERMLLCFHGYGESAESFEPLAQGLPNGFTLIAIDLPFHGKTDWKESLDFAPEILLGIITEIAREQKLEEREICLAGYSMGGRIMLHLVEQMAENLSRIILIAPDGLRENPWYWFATHTWAGNSIFRRTMKRPGWFFNVIRLCDALRLTNRSFNKYVFHYLEDEKARIELYTRWTCFRRFRPGLAEVKRHIMKNSIRVRFVYGQYDRIIPPGRGARFCKEIEPLGTLLVLPAGHQLLQEKYKDSILKLVSD